MVLLIDFDSILYKAVYKVVSFEQMRTALTNYTKPQAKQWLMESVYEYGIERCESSIEEIKAFVNDNHYEQVTSIELYITTCTNSFRKALSKPYKAKRKRNSYVWMLREHYSVNGAFESDTLEADDLIAMRARELGVGNYIVASIDKDLKQIGGHYWSYYTQKTGEVDENGFNETEYKQKQIDFITEDEANYMFWEQMLMGDPGDNVAGIPRIGKKTAEKILKDAKNLFITVAREYLKRDMKEEFRITYKLLKL